MNNTFYQEDNISSLDRNKFLKTFDDKHTDLYILKNNLGMEVALTNYGCALLSIMVPDKTGKFGNVILGHESIEDEINSPEPFLNTTIGRYANRIAFGRFMLCDKLYQLAINNGPNSLHGGPTGFHTKIWDAEQTAQNSITFSYNSKDGEEGFPGNLKVKITYSLHENENTLAIDYRATTDNPTIVNLTNHAFFNLAGPANPSPSISNHSVTINADHYLPIDAFSIPTGHVLSVKTPHMDFFPPPTVRE